MQVILEIQNISFEYKKKSARKDRSSSSSSSSAALKDVSFQVQKGEIFGLLGPNGGGKTTLFKILSTAFPFVSGSVKIFGFDILKFPEQVRRGLGVVFQHPSLDKKLTVSENMVHQSRLYGLTGESSKNKINDLLNRFGLSDRASQRIESLSGGMQRRVEIAKGMIHSPSLLLMDEPSAGLDPGARKDLWSVLSELKSSGVTVLLTTHLMEEAERCGRLAILNHGKLVALGTPMGLKSEIGGDVIVVEVKNPAAFSGQVQAKFGFRPIVLESAVQIEKEQGHKFVPQLVESFPGEILSVTLGKPTLEDVFVHRTGHRFWDKGRE